MFCSVHVCYNDLVTSPVEAEISYDGTVRFFNTLGAEPGDAILIMQTGLK